MSEIKTIIKCLNGHKGNELIILLIRVCYWLTKEIYRVYQSHRRQGKLISFTHIDGDAEEKSGQSLKDYKSEFYVAK